MSDIKELEKALVYQFKDISILKRALTHRSYSKVNNERLEFVGDGILDYAIAIILYHNFPDLAEGVLSKIRAALVNQESLSELANKIQLGKYLLLGDGEEKSGGRQRPSILADCLEAIFAAISLDSGVQQALEVIEHIFKEKLKNADKLIIRDSKSILQEYLQANQINVPEYKVVDSTGPDHDSIFKIECYIPELDIKVIAQGKTKKEASQIAAEESLRIIKEKKIYGKF
ncbi:MAG: ribonuclease III [Neisseriaceae bacterium]